MEDKFSVLKRCFGYDGFRAGQAELIDALTTGRDALGILPTGGGKSLCYQIPALLLPGVTLVISPLIALMQDQVLSLQAAGVPAAFLNSTLSPEEMRTVCRRFRQGDYRLLYVAPERLDVPDFRAAASAASLSLVAVDEVHCISQWGQDFRPSYLRISDFLLSLPNRPPVGAFTATATARVQEDVVRALGLRDPLRVVTGFDRPNLYYAVLRPKDKRATLLRLLRERADRSGIVYCATRRQVDELTDLLREQNVPAVCYHAGLPEQTRRDNQAAFVYDRARVMVATNAFGMGIDKSNVSFVIHFSLPQSLEAYYQEAGRAGRDGAPADCILLYAPGDVQTVRRLLQNDDNIERPEEERRRTQAQALERLDAMVAYCKTARCLRGCLLSYFGQTHPDACGHCENCRTAWQTRDVTQEACMVLSCVARIRRKLGYSVGPALVTQVLRGAKVKRVSELSLDTLSTYGLLHDRSAEQVQALLDCLLEQGLLSLSQPYGALVLTGRARDVLTGGARVLLQERVNRPEKTVEPTAAAAPTDETPDSELLDALRALRLRLARDEGVPAYIIFSNATLRDMAQKRPRTREDFLEVNGVGAVKAARYATPFLTEIARHLDK